MVGDVAVRCREGSVSGVKVARFLEGPLRVRVESREITTLIVLVCI